VTRSLSGRLLVRSALTVVAVLAVLAVVLDRTLESVFLEDLTGSLVAEARAVRAAFRDEPEPVQPAVRSLGRELGVRVTIIRTDGVVVADSSGDPSGFENHAGRPEVRDALAGRVGVASRVSASVGEPFRYVALPPEGGRVVRVALPLSIVEDRLADVRLVIAGGTGLAAVLGVAAVWLVARGLTRPLRRMTDSVARMSAGDLQARVPADGTADLALLGETVNRLAADLGERIEQVREDRHQLDQILAGLDEGVVLIEGEGTVGYRNPRARTMLEAPLEGLRSLGASALRGLVEDVRATGEPSARELEIGQPARTVLATGVPLLPEGRILLVLRDVTAARRIEAMRRDFVADASHELKTPAASIQAAAETVHRAVAEDPQAAVHFAGQLRQDAVRLSRIVSDLLDLSRLETERLPTEEVRLDRIAEEQVHGYRQRAEEGGVVLTAELRPATVAGSPQDLTLLVGNLLDNAIRYTRPGGQVGVAVRPDDSQVILTVSDTGIGIPTRDVPRIFERFYRVDRTRSRETGGTGLGLSIARHVAERHGGRIEAESELGRGSTFRVRLPMGPVQPAGTERR
jgi:two-component system phosphate regulon sensor histidine kinase PhoR